MSGGGGLAEFFQAPPAIFQDVLHNKVRGTRVTTMKVRLRAQACTIWKPGSLRTRILKLNYSSATSPPLSPQEIEAALNKPSWSVRSLLQSNPPQGTTAKSTVSQKELHHLLRLSALPLPTNETEESNMIKTLESQLQFVNAIQTVDTTGVKPLQSIRDETEEALKENEITLESMKGVLEKEVVSGHSRRIRNGRGWGERRGEDEEDRVDPLRLATRKIGRFVVVETGKR